MQESVTASTRNWSSTSRARAPMARRMPISRVRSVTDTSMIFMIPMPPTNRLTPATAPNSEVITLVLELITSASCCESKMLKLSSSFAVILRRSRISAATPATMFAPG